MATCTFYHNPLRAGKKPHLHVTIFLNFHQDIEYTQTCIIFFDKQLLFFFLHVFN